jgi:hypothetical protein
LGVPVPHNAFWTIGHDDDVVVDDVVVVVDDA